MSVAELVTRIWFSAGGFTVGVAISGLTTWLKTHQRPDSDLFRIAFGMVILAATVTAVLYMVSQSQCQTQINQAFLATQVERAEIAKLDRQADDERAEANKTMMLYFLSGQAQGNPEGGRQALREFVAKLDAAKAKRDSADAQRRDTPLALGECGVSQ